MQEEAAVGYFIAQLVVFIAASIAAVVVAIRSNPTLVRFEVDSQDLQELESKEA